MARRDLHEVLHRSKAERYLLTGENELLAQRQHWAAFAEPVASALGGLVVVLALDYVMPKSLSVLTNIFWWAWFAIVARAIWKWLMWRESWLVATDQRLLLNYGLVTRNVAMMPLVKVTDMSYKRSPTGRLLGYGTFVMESAGQDQALRRVDFVAHPDRTYRAICAEIFDVEHQEEAAADDEDYYRFDSGPGEPDHAGEPDPDKADHDEDQDKGPIGIQIRYGTTPRTDPEWSSQTPDLGQSALREADTGPIPYRRPTTDDGEGWSPTTSDQDRGPDLR